MDERVSVSLVLTQDVNGRTPHFPMQTFSTLYYDKTKCHTSQEQLTALIWWPHTWKAFKAARCTCCPAPGPGAACSCVCPVPGRLCTAPSYSGTGKSRHDRVGGPRTWSRDRFTLKAIAKEGTSIRREKKRSIKESIDLNSPMLNQIFYQKYLLINLSAKQKKKSQNNLKCNLGNKRQRLP